MKKIFFVLACISFSSFASITGSFTSDYQEGDLNCHAELVSEQKSNMFKVFQEKLTCRDSEGNGHDSTSLPATYRMNSANSLSILVQGQEIKMEANEIRMSANEFYANLKSSYENDEGENVPAELIWHYQWNGSNLVYVFKLQSAKDGEVVYLETITYH